MPRRLASYQDMSPLKSDMSPEPEDLFIFTGAQVAHTARRRAHVGLRVGANSGPQRHDDFVVERGRGGKPVPAPSGDVPGPELRARVAVPHPLGVVRAGKAARLGRGDHRLEAIQEGLERPGMSLGDLRGEAVLSTDGVGLAPGAS